MTAVHPGGVIKSLRTQDPHARVISILTDLIGFDTTSRNSNLELIHYVRDFLLSHGIESVLVYDKSGGKANLYATVGPTGVQGVMLSGHTDVVPVDGQNWHSDPFVLEVREENIYGRGSADMKGFIACVLAAVPEMVSADLVTPIHLAFSYDEEVGCIGVRRLLDVMATMPVLPVMAIIGEPTSMGIVVAHKGKRAIRVRVRGASAHSAYPTEGVNAIEVAAGLIHYLGELQKNIAEIGPFDTAYQVPHTTLHVGTIRGGTALNIVPDACEFEFEIRHLPEHQIEPLIQSIHDYTVENLEPAMHANDLKSGIAFTELFGYPGLFTVPDAPVVDFVRSLLNGDETAEKISFGSEGGLFSEQMGIPGVVCGPGSILQAHKPDEYVSVEQLKRCSQLVRGLISALQKDNVLIV